MGEVKEFDLERWACVDLDAYFFERPHLLKPPELTRNLRPKIVYFKSDVEKLIKELEAKGRENERLRQCCKDFEFVLEGSRALKQSDEMLNKREDALMRALDYDNPKKALQAKEGEG